MKTIKFYKEKDLPIEFHKSRIVQKINLLEIDERLKKITEAGNNTFLLNNKDVFLDMLTDSGVNAMSDKMQSAMFISDDSYAGSETYNRLANKIKEIFDMEYFLPVHQGRAGEHILIKHFVKANDVIPMNYKFESIVEHIENAGAMHKEFVPEKSFDTYSNDSFKGNFDIEKFKSFIYKNGVSNIPFVRIEAGTNLIGGQPVSLENMEQIAEICKDNNIMLILDASLLQDNLYFIKEREEKCKNMTIREITKKIANLMDIIYFSARKLGFARGGGICMRNRKIFNDLRKYVTAYEGFTTYGGMSVREMEAITVGLEETMDEKVISQGPSFIKFMATELNEIGIPVVTPPGGLGVHIDAKEFLPHISTNRYPAASLASALYIAGGIRGMERGSVSAGRKPDGKENVADMELLRLALPRRVFTLSHIKYAISRLHWIYDNREIIEGLKFAYEPATLRFYFGLLIPVSDWQTNLIKQFKIDFDNSL